MSASSRHENLKWVREHSSGCLPSNTDTKKWKSHDFGVPAGNGGAGSYVAIFSDGSSIDVCGLTCQEARAQAKRLAPDGTEIVDFFPIQVERIKLRTVNVSRSVRVVQGHAANEELTAVLALDRHSKNLLTAIGT